MVGSIRDRTTAKRAIVIEITLMLVLPSIWYRAGNSARIDSRKPTAKLTDVLQMPKI